MWHCMRVCMCVYMCVSWKSRDTRMSSIDWISIDWVRDLSLRSQTPAPVTGVSTTPTMSRSDFPAQYASEFKGAGTWLIYICAVNWFGSVMWLLHHTLTRCIHIYKEHVCTSMYTRAYVHIYETYICVLQDWRLMNIFAHNRLHTRMDSHTIGHIHAYTHTCYMSRCSNWRGGCHSTYVRTYMQSDIHIYKH